MSKLEKRMKLANEAVELIKEFREEAGILGHNPLKSVTIKEDGEIIEEDFQEIFSLSDLERYAIKWYYKNVGMGLALANLEYDFKKFSKEEFKEYVGNLKYAEYRCEEIYKRLEEIEEEASELYE